MRMVVVSRVCRELTTRHLRGVMRPLFVVSVPGRPRGRFGVFSFWLESRPTVI